MKRRAAYIVAVIVLSLAGYVLLSKTPASKPAEIPPPERHAAAEGKVEISPGWEVEISSELEGRIESFPVKEGEAVKKGDLIATLANGDLRAKIREAEAELRVARSRFRETASGSRQEEIRGALAELERAMAAVDYERESLKRHRELYEKGYIPREQLDERERNLKVADANARKAAEGKALLEKGPKKETLALLEDEVRMAAAKVEYYRQLLAKTFITAPLTGKVIRKYLQQGEGVTKDKPVAAVADTSKLRVNAEVDETDIGMVSLGAAAEVSSDAFMSRVFKGEVEEISDYAGIRKVKPNDQAKNVDMKVVQVKIRLTENTQLKPGMTVDVKIMPGKRAQLARLRYN
jgi:multidrug resistance efflux pump